MKAGAHVLCEKPLCVDAGEAREMIGSSNGTGKALMVGFQLHFHAGVRRMRQLIEEGAVGTVGHAHVRVGSYITLRNSLSRYQETLEGSLLLDYAHQPDLLLWLLDELPAGVTLTGLKAGNMPLASNPNVMALTLDYARPLLATVHLNYIQMPQRHEWEIVGDKGWIVMDADRGTIRLGQRETETESTETFSLDPDLAYRMEHQAFLDHLDGLRPPESPAPMAVRSVELFTMAMQSWQENRRVACVWADYSRSAAAGPL
jgi:predicted dehydrogenase